MKKKPRTHKHKPIKVSEGTVTTLYKCKCGEYFCKWDFEYKGNSDDGKVMVGD